MKHLISLLALVVSTPLFAQTGAHTAPLYEETFNARHDRIQFRNGAALGGPATGVSGKTGDLAYIGTPKSSEQEPNGPVAAAISPIAPDSLSAFTVTFWYFLDENGPVLQVPVNTAGFMLLLQERGFELRIEQSITDPKLQAFTPGITGPLAGWRDTGKWIFAAISWNQANNTVTVHQGLPNQPVAYMRDMTRDVAAKPSLPRIDLARYSETIGNTHIRADRPLTGRLDNLRVYDRVLERAELEKIRQADIANIPVSAK